MGGVGRILKECREEKGVGAEVGVGRGCGVARHAGKGRGGAVISGHTLATVSAISEVDAALLLQDGGLHIIVEYSQLGVVGPPLQTAVVIGSEDAGVVQLERVVLSACVWGLGGGGKGLADVWNCR